MAPTPNSCGGRYASAAGQVARRICLHAHEHEDELFQIIKGTLYMQFRDRTEVVKEGEIIVVPKGVEHNPMTKNGEEVHVLLFEKSPFTFGTICPIGF